MKEKKIFFLTLDPTFSYFFKFIFYQNKYSYPSKKKKFVRPKMFDLKNIVVWSHEIVILKNVLFLNYFIHQRKILISQ